MTRTSPRIAVDLAPETADVYRDALRRMQELGVPVLVAGSFATAYYTGRAPHTKDLDLFLAPADLDPALRGLEGAGFETRTPYPFWLAKAFRGEIFVDLITRGSNGVWEVDRGWLEHAPAATLLDVDVRVCPLEELVWSKATIMSRERYDGNEVIRLLRAGGADVDWARLRSLFGPHWRLLLAYLSLFGLAWPDAWQAVPEDLVAELARRFREEPPAGRGLVPSLCGGTLLSPRDYLDAIDVEGCRDARLRPVGTLEPAELEPWNEAMRRGDT